MLNFESNRGVRFCDGLTRRDFLRVGSLSAGSIGLSLAELGTLRAGGAASSGQMNCILLFLVGGPSHLDTFDLKPGAPDNVRGPFRPIQTTVPGMQICEHLPRTAEMANRFAIVRSVHHDSAPIHETGHQLMQTGQLFRGGLDYPHYGAVVSHLRGRRPSALPAFMIVPGPIGNTGVSVSHGQGAGYLGVRHEPYYPHVRVAGAEVLRSPGAVRGFGVPQPRPPTRPPAGGLDPARLQNRRALLDAVDNAQRVFDATMDTRPGDTAAQRAFSLIFSPIARRAFDIGAEPEDLRDRYGQNTFGQSCLLARRLVENGVRLVTVNMFDTVFNNITWDCHADGGLLKASLADYRNTLCPMFDSAYTALLEDLHERGLLETTLVVAMGEFGRTPHLNPNGGRDHWPGVWSILFAGGRVRGGQVIGASDRIGAEPRDRPVSAAEVAATVYHGLGIDLNTRIPGPENRLLPIAEGKPIEELFCG